MRRRHSFFPLRQYKSDGDLGDCQDEKEDADRDPASGFDDRVFVTPWLSDAESTDGQRSQNGDREFP